MKKRMALILCILFVLSAFSPSAFATTSSSEESSLYVATTACPSEYVAFAQQNAAAFLRGTGETVDYTEVRVGTPFAFANPGADVYYFPILIDGVITYLFSVYPDETLGYCGTLSTFLAKELEELASYTSPDSPLHLTLEEGTLCATVGEKKMILFQHTPKLWEESEESERESAQESTLSISTSQSALTVINAKSSQEWSISAPTRATSNYIALNTSDQAYVEGWCGAFCTAAILRTVGYPNVTAWRVINAFFRQPVAGSSITLDQAVAYGNYTGVSAIHANGTLSQSALIAEIDGGRPVLLQMHSSSDDHAVVLRGYSGNLWNIWDPASGSYVTYTAGGTYYPTWSGGAYTNVDTVYSWD